MAPGILVPHPGIEPTSPASQSGLLTTGPPGKSLTGLFLPYPTVILLGHHGFHTHTYTDAHTPVLLDEITIYNSTTVCKRWLCSNT